MSSISYLAVAEVNDIGLEDTVRRILPARTLTVFLYELITTAKIMTRRTDFEKKEPLSLREFSLKCSETLDKGIDAYKSINSLNDSMRTVRMLETSEIHSALDEMESVIVHLASAKSGGNINKTREELESRGLKDIL